MKYGIIGAGPSGLTMALFLKEKCQVLEKNNHPGGHASSFTEKGFTFDYGPHIMFSKNKNILDFMIATLKNNVQKCRRNNKISYKGRLIKYPFENDLKSLPLEDNFECLKTYLFNPYKKKYKNPQNLRQWLLSHFGKGICEKYLFPYNEKVWRIPVSKLSMIWTERIPLPPALDIIKSSIGFETEGYLHQLYYYYPLRGGYQAISNAWAKKVPVRYNFTVKKVEKTRQGKFIVSDGRERLMFDRIISTIPIHELVKLINIPIPGRVKRAIKGLIVNPTYGVCLGIKGVDKNKFTAVYFPEASFLVNRINFPKTFSPFNAPKGYYSLQAEIVCRKNAKIWREKDDVIIDHVIDGLIERRIIENRKDIVYKKVLRSEYAYVVYDTEYEKNTDIIRSWFPKQGIHLVGRFSYFEYVNVDMVIARSLEIASLLNKSEKISILSPAHQNQDYIKEFVKSVFKDVVEPLKRKGIKSKVIIAEDGSTDNTRPILQSLQKKYPLKLLLAKERLGPVQAIKNLFAEASGDLIFFLDSDGEISPRYFWDLYEVFKKENLGVAVAYKMKRKPWYRFLISRVNNFWLQLLFNTGIRDSNSGFRLYKAEIGKWLVQESGFLKYNFNSEQIILAVKRGFKVGETGTPHHARESMVFRPQKLLQILFLAFWELFKFRIYLFERNIFTTFALLIGRYSRRVLPLRFAQSKRLVGQMGLP